MDLMQDPVGCKLGCLRASTRPMSIDRLRSTDPISPVLVGPLAWMKALDSIGYPRCVHLRRSNAKQSLYVCTDTSHAGSVDPSHRMMSEESMPDFSSFRLLAGQDDAVSVDLLEETALVLTMPSDNPVRCNLHPTGSADSGT